MKVALELLESREKKSISKEAVEILKYLLIMFQSFPKKLIETYDLIKKIKVINPNYSESLLRQDIQSLRDKGILIVSIIGKSGYKLPSSEEDIIGFYNRYMNHIVPMLKRVSISHEIIQKQTVNEVNLLSSEYNLKILRELINIVKGIN